MIPEQKPKFNCEQCQNCKHERPDIIETIKNKTNSEQIPQNISDLFMNVFDIYHISLNKHEWKTYVISTNKYLLNNNQNYNLYNYETENHNIFCWKIVSKTPVKIESYQEGNQKDIYSNPLWYSE